MTIETRFDSNYRKVLVAARRARQIQSGPMLWSHTLHQGLPHRPGRDRRRQDCLRQERDEVVKPLVEGPAIPILLS